MKLNQIFISLVLFKACFVIGCTLLISQSASAATPLLERVRAGQSTNIVTIGTSLTYGASWVSSMETWLKSESPNPANVTVFNEGIGGASSQNATPVLSGLVTQMPLALAHNPDAVFIEFTMNDAYSPYGVTQQQSKDNLLNMINQFQAQNPEVIVILQTMNNPIGVHLTSRPDIADYYQGYRDIAAQEGLLLIDHYPAWLDLLNNDPTTWNSYVPDGIHPNIAGHDAIVLPGIQAALAVPTPAALPAGLALLGLAMTRRRRVRR